MMTNACQNETPVRCEAGCMCPVKKLLMEDWQQVLEQLLLLKTCQHVLSHCCLPGDSFTIQMAHLQSISDAMECFQARFRISHATCAAHKRKHFFRAHAARGWGVMLTQGVELLWSMC